MKFRAALAGVVAAALFWGFRSMLLDHAPAAFSSPQEDMSFAWFVPLYSLYVFWTDRERTFAAAGRPSVWGFVATLPFFALGFLGARGLQLRFEVVSFAGLIFTLTWGFWGFACARTILFPVAFLLFCIPLATFLDVVTVHLRLFATAIASGILHGFGGDFVRNGTVIASGDGSFAIDIAEPCSGLRSIFALMALAAGYAYRLKTTVPRKFAVFASSVPLAVFGNVMRILSICLVSRFASREFATGFYHDYSGYVVFLVAIGLLLVIGETLAAKGGADGEGASASARNAVAVPITRGEVVLCSIATACACACLVPQGFVPRVTVAEAPAVALPDLEGFESVAVEPGEAERTVLPADTRIERRNYTLPYGPYAQVTLVIGGAGKGSIHRPELCLPAQGFLMRDPETAVVSGVEWRRIRLERGASSCRFAYTFFNQEGYGTSSHVKRIFRDVWDRSVLGRADRWVMLTVFSPEPDADRFDAFLGSLKGVVK